MLSESKRPCNMIIRRVYTSGGGGGGALPYERGGDARRKFGIKPIKETNLGVAQPIFDPQKRLF